MNWSINVRLAAGLASENHYRYAVLARRWPGVGWVYYLAPVGSAAERRLRTWRRRYDAAQHA